MKICPNLLIIQGENTIRDTSESPIDNIRYTCQCPWEHQHFEEIRELFADGKHRNISSVSKELELADVSLSDYLTTKYGLWLDMRTTDDDTLHGSGRKIEGAIQSIQIEIEKEGESAGNLEAYVYYVQDAQLNFEDGRLISAVY